jgi:hypothetical protein
VQTPDGVPLDKALEKLAQSGGSGIHIGTEPPTDENVHVWIDTDEEPEEEPSGIDVTAEVGQTIIVKAVDENGKPTEWEAVDRTNWVDIEEKTFYDGSVSVSGNTAFLTDDTYLFVPGETYSVEWEGTTFECTCVECLIQGFPTVGFGNPYIYGGDYGEEPFFVASMFGLGTLVMAFTDGTYHVKVTGPQYTFHPLSRELLPEGSTYYIDVTYEFDSKDIYLSSVTQTELKSALAKGYNIVARTVEPSKSIWTYYTMALHANDQTAHFYGFNPSSKRMVWLNFTPNQTTGGYDITSGSV